MHKIKTLNDLEWILWRDKEDVISKDDKLVSVNELKAEAKKWIKEIKRTKKDGLSLQEPEEVLATFFNIK